MTPELVYAGTALVLGLGGMATVVHLAHLKLKPPADERVVELEKRLATAQAKISAIEGPPKQRMPGPPFHMGPVP